MNRWADAKRAGVTNKTIIAAIALEHDEPLSLRAIQFAADHEAKLILVHAMESLPASNADFPIPANKEAITEFLAAEAAQSLKKIASNATMQTQIEVEGGKAAQIIERLVRDHAADLLALAQESHKTGAKGYSVPLLISLCVLDHARSSS